MPLVQTRGAASAQGFGEFAQVTAVNYIEEVFSCFLYTGNGSTQTITNGIDLAGKGGLIVTKARSASGAAAAMQWTSDVTGLDKSLESNTTSTGVGVSPFVFNANGYQINTANARWNTSATTYVNWTFRKQPKFFDVVTYTGNGVAGRTVPHNLGSIPGMIVVKSTSAAANWVVYHRSLGNDYAIYLDMTEQQDGPGKPSWNFTNPTSTEFTVAANGWNTNNTGTQYVAYLFAHDAGGFGLSGEDNVISCGSYTGTGAAGNFVSLGYEPQWLLIKRTNTTGNWLVLDNMRGITTGGVDAGLFPNLSNAEDSANDYLSVNATGFELTGVSTTVNASGSTYIYIAIRRGPMKVPTSGAAVYNGVLVNSSSSTQTVNAGFPVDLAIKDYRNLVNGAMWFDRLRGITGPAGVIANRRLLSATQGAEANSSDINGTTQTGVTELGIGTGFTSVDWFFQRAPGFFDVVCYTGTGSARTVAHNLAAVPELMIVKTRNAVGGWTVYSASSGPSNYQYLNTTAAASSTSTTWNNTAPTASVFTVGTDSEVNASGGTFVAYLFATCPGVSRVGSYTGTGTTQTINCGFTGGARFVMIKRTDAAGDWYVWDSARGIVAGNDPYLLLNSTAAEVTNTDFVDTASVGFEISSTAPAEINALYGTYIFLAVA